jgi:hypothetical protein
MPNFTIFVSSTLSDLKHVRESLGQFLVALGYQPVLFERGDIAHVEDTLDRDSAAEVSAADALICIIGRRYGTEASKQQAHNTEERISITELEIQTALDRGKLVWVFVEKSVHAEFQTYQQNRATKRNITRMKLAHADDIRVYRLLQKLQFNRPLTTPIVPFDRIEDITGYLKRQFGGILHDYVTRGGDRAIRRLAFSSAVDAAKEIEGRLRDSLQSQEVVYIRWLGMSMFNAWNVLSDKLEKVLPGSTASKVFVQIAMLDSKWKGFRSINPVWAKQAETIYRNIKSFQGRDFMNRKDYTIQVRRYAHMPCVHGVLINEQYLFMGNCSWENGIMYAGTKWYEFFDTGDPYGQSRISLFRGWFNYCFLGR